ncbi:alpha/beta hydrolase [Salinibacterium sp. G-O1]|uniref:alpha/beta fold hydrolase n=1 Tax=Salinibacterium sp. G-O1 TaxID=3046208 RepID=UPI0024B98401|nr:alpha/beta hydrolase [Salinibacterium sp. G-O1]MDJ0335457.1 alpha/beta hydrolase [Salinibacterium sp. G-O1]
MLPVRTSLPTAGRYAPHPLVDDEAVFRLERTAVRGEPGVIVARHLPERESEQATLFLHGAAGSWSTWTPLLLAALDTGDALPDPVLLDLPGWGAGTLNETSDATSIDAVCELIRAAALHLGYTRWHIVGHSMGGFIAMHMAARWPEEVLSVVSVSGTTWSVIDSVRHPVRNFRAVPGFVMLWRVMAVLSALGTAGLALVRGMRDVGLLRAAAFPLFRRPFRIDASVIDALSREVRPRAFLAAVSMTRDYGPNGVWASIACPVTALKGDRDVFVRDSDLERLTRLLPASRTQVIADCGHFANVERPDAVLAAIIATR